MGNKCFTANDEEPIFTKLPPHTSQRKKSSVGQIDWSSESSVKHRSAINCLHNYAIGKILSETNEKTNDTQLPHVDDPKSHSSKQNCQLHFSKDIEQEIVIDREYLTLDAGRDSSEVQGPLLSLCEKNSPSDVSSFTMGRMDREDCCEDRDVIAERKKTVKACNREHGESAGFRKAWERSNFTESAPDFGMDQLFAAVDSNGGSSQGS